MADVVSESASQLARTVSQLGAVGALIVITLWLVYQQTELQTVAQTERSNLGRDIDALGVSLSLHMERSNTRQREILAMLRLICSNTASDTGQRSACLAEQPQR